MHASGVWFIMLTAVGTSILFSESTSITKKSSFFNTLTIKLRLGYRICTSFKINLVLSYIGCDFISKWTFLEISDIK